MYKMDIPPNTMRGKGLLTIAALFWRKRCYLLMHLDETSFNNTVILNYDTGRGFHDTQTF